MRSYFTFNGHDSKDFGIWIEYLPDASFPERRGEAYQIAGKNGTQWCEEGTFENVEQEYKIWYRDWTGGKDMYHAGDDIANWLIGSSGYCRLEDTYNSETFRLARFAGPLDFQTTLRKFGRVMLVFDCLPQRYLKTGETAVTLMENVTLSSNLNATQTTATLSNPYAFPAKPILRITGTGNVGISSENTVNGEMMVITVALGDTETTVTIDCDSYDINVIPAAVSYDSDYPILTTLQPGVNTFSTIPVTTNPGTIKKLEVIPRWWTL